MNKNEDIVKIDYSYNTEACIKIRQAMKNKGYTQEKLAEIVGTSKQTITNILKGSMPKIENLAKIAITLDLSIDELLGIAQSKQKSKKSDSYYFEAIKSFVEISKCRLCIDMIPLPDDLAPSASLSLIIDSNELAYYIQEYNERLNLINVLSPETKDHLKNVIIEDFDKMMSMDYEFNNNLDMIEIKDEIFSYLYSYSHDKISRTVIEEIPDTKELQGLI